MPSIIDQIREQQAWEQPKKSGSAGLIVGAIAAFGVGIILVIGWGALPSLSIKGLSAQRNAAPAAAPARQPDISIPVGGRLGDASESSLLRTCIPARFTAGGQMQNKDIYRLLQTANQMMSVASMVGAQQNVTSAGAKGFAIIWADVADCVFRQNGWNLCDPDNRALAVEAIGAFVRQTALAAAPEQDGEFKKVMATLQGKQRQAIEHAMYNTRATRDRVLATLKTRAQEGRFIASDFGFFTPAAVMQIVKDTKPISDACASGS